MIRTRTLLLLLFLFAAPLLQAQSVIRVSDPEKGKVYVIHEGDWLRAYAYTDSTYHEGRITYIGEKGVQLENHTYTLDQLRLCNFNSHRREVTCDVADFAGNTFMVVGEVVFRAGIEICSYGEKAAGVIGLPTIGIGGAIWITGAIAHGVVYPLLAANNDWHFPATYSAELSDDVRHRRKVAEPIQP